MARLGEIGVPTLLIGGADDWIMPFEHGQARLANGIRGATSVVLDRSGHFPFVEEPDRFDDAVRSWLAGVTIPPRPTGPPRQ